MSREWKPGDVALVEVGCESNRHRGMFLFGGWRYGDDKWVANDPAIVTARPLVVIDPEDREKVTSLIRAVDLAAGHDTTAVYPHRIQNFTVALRSLVTPPKPDEPKGWLSAVEDADGNRWCLHGGPTEPGLEWYSPDLNARRPYSHIAAVRILSEGVQ